jgi:RES domain-containing protein
VEVYRVTRRKFAGENPFDGEGAFPFGGRWSSVGTRVSYTAQHRSLAILEYRAHIDLALVPNDLVIATLDIPDDIAIAATPPLPEEWREYPAPASLRQIGDRFVAEGRAALLLIPSVLVPQENNLILNPLHPDAAKMVWRQPLVPFLYDRRLLSQHP